MDNSKHMLRQIKTGKQAVLIKLHSLKL